MTKFRGRGESSKVYTAARDRITFVTSLKIYRPGIWVLRRSTFFSEIASESRKNTEPRKFRLYGKYLNDVKVRRVPFPLSRKISFAKLESVHV